MPREALILVPTAREARAIAAAAGLADDRIALCGFGPVAAAARTAALIAEHRPHRVLLAGIAGSHSDELFPVGAASRFASVAVDGIGAGAGDSYQPAAAIGFPHWPGDPGTPRIGDRVDFDGEGRGLLLTVCAASGSPAEADARRRRHPEVVAEDMEGFGVATACALAAVPLVIVRGASNRAGDRAVAGWQIGPALAAAGALLRTLAPRI